MSGLFGPGKRVETGLFDPQQFTQRLKDQGLWPDPDKYPPGTMLAVTSCKVVEVLVKDDTSVKKGDPLFVLNRPLPPPLTTPLSPFSPLPEYLKVQIKESLEQCQQHQSATIVDNTDPPMPTHHNVDAAQLLLNFNKFDTVVDYSDHLFSAHSSPETQQPPIDWVNKIQEDRRILMERLPDTIFVRVYESRLDILRAAILGQKGTPYHDGLFFFDVCFPINYPDSPPLVRYHSGVPGISPHLNKCGDVRLVLCNELARQEHMWIPGTSNMLQLLLSIQDLILNAKPYFNILGTARSTISLIQERKSFLFNENIVVKSLETMVYTMNKPPKNFEDLVLGHFHTCVHDILMACKGYIEGQQEVGCLVSDSNHAPSIKFKKDVTSCIKPLIKAFDKIGAKEAQEYLHLTEEKSASPANMPTRTPVNEGIHDAAHKKRKVEEDINPAAKKERKVVVVKEISDPAEKEGKVDEDVIDALNLMKKVAEEIIAAVNKKNKVVVDEGTNDSAKEESKVPDIDIYPPHARFTIKASFDCVITKVLVSAGTEVEKGQPLYVMGPRRTEDILLNISSRAPSKESKVEYLMIHKILLMNRRSHVGIFSMEDVLVDHQQQLEDSSRMARGLGNEEDDVLKSFENFRKFDYVTEISDHFFSTENSALNQPSKEWADMIHKDWTILEKHLPETILVRVDKSRMDLLRAVIIGPEGTPYRDGLFFFDVCFPSNYPSSPPLVHYHSGGFCINPNLYKCGKVDLSLPKTTGSQETMWVPGSSTILELLVSIQNRILTTNPIYNDLTYAIMRGSVYGKLFSACYNENSIVKSLKTMVQVMNKPPKNFEDFVVGHFRNRVRNVMVTCNRKAHSIMFKDDLALCTKLLVAAFNKIGAKVPEEFLP